MWSLKNRAELFLAHLTDKEKQQLHNELLAVQQILKPTNEFLCIQSLQKRGTSSLCRRTKKSSTISKWPQ
jgi:hypothetical protein